jgi:hypothetical protein
MVNPMGTRGVLARAFAEVLHELWKAELPYISPINFRVRSFHERVGFLHLPFSSKLYPHTQLSSADHNSTIRKSF